MQTITFRDYLLKRKNDAQTWYILSMLSERQDYRTLELYFAENGLLDAFLDLWNEFETELDRCRS